jgi:hypothetical protein
VVKDRCLLVRQLGRGGGKGDPDGAVKHEDGGFANGVQ